MIKGSLVAKHCFTQSVLSGFLLSFAVLIRSSDQAENTGEDDTGSHLLKVIRACVAKNGDNLEKGLIAIDLATQTE